VSAAFDAGCSRTQPRSETRRGAQPDHHLGPGNDANSGRIAAKQAVDHELSANVITLNAPAQLPTSIRRQSMTPLISRDECGGTRGRDRQVGLVRMLISKSRVRSRGGRASRASRRAAPRAPSLSAQRLTTPYKADRSPHTISARRKQWLRWCDTPRDGRVMAARHMRDDFPEYSRTPRRPGARSVIRQSPPPAG